MIISEHAKLEIVTKSNKKYDVDESYIVEKSLTTTQSCSSGGGIPAGSCNAGTMSVSFRAPAGMSKKDLFMAKIKLYVWYGSYDPKQIGEYNVTSSTKNGNVYTVSASDNIVLLDENCYSAKDVQDAENGLIEILGGTLRDPATILSFICNTYSVPHLNHDENVEKVPDSGNVKLCTSVSNECSTESVKDFASYIAEYLGAFIVADENGKVRFCRLGDREPDIEINSSNIAIGTYQRSPYYVFPSMWRVCFDSGFSNYWYASPLPVDAAPLTVDVTNNPFWQYQEDKIPSDLYAGKTTEMIALPWDYIYKAATDENGKHLINPFSATVYVPYLFRVCDLVTIKDPDTNEKYRTYITDVTWTFRGGQTISCAGEDTRTLSVGKSRSMAKRGTDYSKYLYRKSKKSGESSNTTYKLTKTGHTISLKGSDGSESVVNDSDTVYTHPTNTSHSKGMYKFANDEFGHVSDAEEVTKQDIVDLGIPGQDTTYTGGSTDFGTITVDNNTIKISDAVGISTAGKTYTIDDVEVTAYEGAEIFNNYERNIASGHYSHAEGSYTEASGHYSHAEGFSTEASGGHSHVEGFTSSASGDCSHAEGFNTHARGSCSHTEGCNVEAIGSYSHAEGKSTIAKSDFQHVLGKYNFPDSNNKYVFIIGNGTDNNDLSNAIAIDWDGNIFCYGDKTSLNAQIDANTKKLSGIAANANNYVHPTTSGNKHIPSGGSSGQILRWSADGTAVWGADNNTTYNDATQSTHGLMSAADKKKLDGMDLTKYLPKSGGVMTGAIDTVTNGVDITVGPNRSNNSNPTLVAGGSYEVPDVLTNTLKNYKSLIGSYCNKKTGAWFNIISVRHRNGYGDGANYGMYLYSALTNGGNLIWNKQTAANKWQGERTLLDSVNYASYALAKDGTAKKAEAMSNGTLRSGFYVNAAANSTSGYTWFRMATCKISGAYETVNTTFLITSGMVGHALLSCGIRNDGTGKAVESCNLNFSARNGSIAMPANMFRIVAINSDTGVTYELWGQISARRRGVRYTVLDERNISGGKYNIWTLESHSDADAKTAPTTGNYYVNSTDTSIAATLTDSGWVAMTVEGYAKSGTVKYRTYGKQITITGSVVLKNDIATSYPAPQYIASTTFDFSKIVGCSGVGRSSSGVGAYVAVENYNGDNLVCVYALGSKIAAGSTLYFTITGFID